MVITLFYLRTINFLTKCTECVDIYLQIQSTRTWNKQQLKKI